MVCVRCATGMVRAWINGSVSLLVAVGDGFALPLGEVEVAVGSKDQKTKVPSSEHVAMVCFAEDEVVVVAVVGTHNTERTGALWVEITDSSSCGVVCAVNLV